MVTQCTRYDRLVANRDSRKMDMYIQVKIDFFTWLIINEHCNSIQLELSTKI